MGYLIRLAFIIGAAALIAGCGGSQPPIGAPSAMPQNQSSTIASRAVQGYKLIYSFPGGAGGSDPVNSLTFVNGIAFGTTNSGGDVSGCNCGVVFASGKVIYNFKGAASQDGGGPTGDLLLVGKTLYGTTNSGGMTRGVCASNPAGAGCGTVFAADTAGHERVVYRFKGGKDGEAPVGGLVVRKGVLYGATAWGGTGTTCTSGTPPGCGVIFAIDLSGHEKVLHRFTGGPDGAYQLRGLFFLSGALYGTTFNGGASCPYGPGCGTVFRITPSGDESIIYAFKGGSDGMFPLAPLIGVHGLLYGTTTVGGCSRKCGSSEGYGTIFKMSASGNETILYRFPHYIKGQKGQPGPEQPAGTLVLLNNRLFGTTQAGGCFACEGTIYSVTLKGRVTILYAFTSGSGNGQDPGGLTIEPSTQTLYGSTRGGGSSGNGTIFSYTQ